MSLLIGLGVAGAVFGGLLLERYLGHVQTAIEAKTVDLRFRLRGPRRVDPSVAVVAVDTQSIARLGRWPWSRSVHAALVDRLREWGASTVAFDVLFTEPAGVREVARLASVAAALPSPGAAGDSPAVAAARARLGQAIAEADVDQTLARALEMAIADDAALGVLAFNFAFAGDAGSRRFLGDVLGTNEEQAILDLASYLSRDQNTAVLRTAPPDLALGIRPVPVELAHQAAALGFANAVFDVDGALRRERVAVVYSPAAREAAIGGADPRQALRDPKARVQAYMPLAVAAVATHLRLSVDQLVLDLPAGELRFPAPGDDGGARTIRFDPADGTARVDFPGPTGTVPTYSYADVLDGRPTDADGRPVDWREAFGGKLVFVGTTDEGLGDVFVTPFTARLPGVEKQAVVAENLLAGRQLRAPADPILAAGLSALAAGAVVALVAGSLGTLGALAVLAALAGGWLGWTYHDFVARGMVWNWTVPVVTAVLSYAGVVGHRVAVERRARRALAARSRFIQDTFGRYLSEEVVARLVESPHGLELGGERRNLTIMMTDLRGFTSLCERTPPESVVKVLNAYLGGMTDVVFKHGGTIDEFIGDSILALFGAPETRPDDARRAVACAVEMQLVMTSVNERLRSSGLPEVEMGIAINTGEVVVGNIGSERRSKYGVVGSAINLTARIESRSVGGQILVSEDTLREAGPGVLTGPSVEVRAKGVSRPVMAWEVRGIGEPYNLRLPDVGADLVLLGDGIEVEFSVVEGKEVSEVVRRGTLVSLGVHAAELACDSRSLPTGDLKLRVLRPDGSRLADDLYAKILDRPAVVGSCVMAFTSTPAPIREHFAAVLHGASGG